MAATTTASMTFDPFFGNKRSRLLVDFRFDFGTTPEQVIIAWTMS